MKTNLLLLIVICLCKISFASTISDSLSLSYYSGNNTQIFQTYSDMLFTGEKAKGFKLNYIFSIPNSTFQLNLGLASGTAKVEGVSYLDSSRRQTVSVDEVVPEIGFVKTVEWPWFTNLWWTSPYVTFLCGGGVTLGNYTLTDTLNNITLKEFYPSYYYFVGIKRGFSEKNKWFIASQFLINGLNVDFGDNYSQKRGFTVNLGAGYNFN